MPTSPARVLLVVDDIQRSDRISEELTAIGLDASCCFSAGEAVSAVMSDPPEAVLVDAEVEDAESLMRWLRRGYTGMVCLLHEFDGAGHWRSWSEGGEEVLSGNDETETVVARLMGALAAGPRVAVRAGRP